MDSVCVCMCWRGQGKTLQLFKKEVPKEQHHKSSTEATVAMTMCGNFGKIQRTMTAGPKDFMDAAQCSVGILIVCVGLCSAGSHLPRASCNMSQRGKKHFLAS